MQSQVPGRNNSAGWVSGGWPGPGLLGKPCWALEAAGSSCRAASVIPASVSRVSDCISFSWKTADMVGVSGREASVWEKQV